MGASQMSTHTGLLIKHTRHGKMVNLHQTDKWWITENGQRFRKTDGRLETGAWNCPIRLKLDSIVPLPPTTSDKPPTRAVSSLLRPQPTRIV